MSYKPLILGIVFFVGPLIASCSGRFTRTDEDLSALREDVRQAQVDEEYYFLAKASIDRAAALVKKIDALSADGRSTAADYREARSMLDQARVNARAAREEFGDVLEIRKRAIEEGAKQLFSESFDRSDRRFSRAIGVYLGQSRPKQPAVKSELIASYDRLELDSISTKMLAGPREIIQQAISSGAQRLAPDALAKARRSTGRAERFIREQRHNTPGIMEKVDQAFFDADWLRESMRRRGITMASSSPSRAPAPPAREPPPPQQRVEESGNGAFFAILGALAGILGSLGVFEIVHHLRGKRKIRPLRHV